MAEEQEASADTQAEQPVAETASDQGDTAQEAQQVQSNDAGSAETGQPQQEMTNAEFAGLDLSKLPEEAQSEIKSWAQKREQDQMRYITQKAQEYKNLEQKAKYYDEYVSSPEYSQFKDWYQTKGQNPPAQSAQVDAATKHFENAGFTSDEAASMAQAVRNEIHQAVQQEKQAFSSQMQNLQYQQQIVKAQQEVENLAKIHPDVYDMIDSGAFKPFVEQFCVRDNQPLEVAYAKCKEAMAYFQKQGQKAVNQRVQEKKKAVSATPSPAGDTEIVYVEKGSTAAVTQQRVDDAAFKAALAGKKVKVRVKKT